jgi:mannose/cellobiose epimerase-like protein (N-acyl-D-glucosamine 2-epimerase family)
VLARLAENRAIIRRGAWRGREFHYATIYAGIEPTDEDRKEHMRDWIAACLYQLADPAHNKDAYSRVQALIALSELHGLAAPRVVHMTVPTLEQIDAEIARREGP